MNKDRKEYLKKWREEHKKQIAEYKKEYVKNNGCSYKRLQMKYKNLQHQLEEKDKVIDEILNFASFDSYCPYECFCDEEQDECDKVKKICDCEICKDNYKKCWLKYFENKASEIKNE